MQVGNITIRHLFHQDRRHVVPLYQRPYVWQQETQWEPLWEDIRSVAERLPINPDTRSHFIGAIVLEYVPQHAGALEIRLVIDGQQRLTTIQLALEAFYDYCGTIGADQHHRTIEKLVRNDDPMSTNPIERFKVWPTNVDQVPFQRVMDARSPVELKRMYEHAPTLHRLGHPILDCYLYFYEAISEWIEEVSEERDSRLTALVQAMRDHVALVVIDVGKDDDAQVIFETLNARGTPLLPSDLVKNYLLRCADLQKDSLEQLYQTYWQPFEVDKAYWRQEIGRGHAKRPRIDLFLQNYLSLLVRDEVPVGHLYATFRDVSSKPDAGTAREQLQSVHRYADIYKSFEQHKGCARSATFFHRLDAMELGTAHPYLMELYAIHGGKAPEVSQALELIESFLVRRLVCQLTTRSYGRFFIDLIATLDGPTESLPTRVRNALSASQAENGRWPTDDELRSAWLSAPLYKTMLRSRLRMILEALDSELATGLGEKYVLKERLTVEHLMPQIWKAYWSLPEGAKAEMAANRDHLIHTLGNLTLLSKKLNPSVSNGAWEPKITEIKKKSNINLNVHLWDGWGAADWNEDAIKDRGRALFEKAVKIWSR